jgi:hypothetical protein
MNFQENLWKEDPRIGLLGRWAIAASISIPKMTIVNVLIYLRTLPTATVAAKQSRDSDCADLLLFPPEIHSGFSSSFFLPIPFSLILCMRIYLRITT